MLNKIIPAIEDCTETIRKTICEFLNKHRSEIVIKFQEKAESDFKLIIDKITNAKAETEDISKVKKRISNQ